MPHDKFILEPNPIKNETTCVSVNLVTPLTSLVVLIMNASKNAGRHVIIKMPNRLTFRSKSVARCVRFRLISPSTEVVVNNLSWPEVIRHVKMAINQNIKIG